MSFINSAIGGYAVGFRPHGHAYGRSRFHGFGDSRTQNSGPQTRYARRGQRVENPQPVQRTRTKSVSGSSSLSLTITTAEGDTVQLSVEAQSLRQSQRSVSRTPGGVARSVNQSQQRNLSASVSVHGDLNDKEFGAIQSLLESIGSGQSPTLSASGSLSSYDYTLTRSHQVSASNVAVFG